MSYFTNSYPLANNQNIDFTGKAFNNPYKLLQKAGKKRSYKRKHRRKNKNKTYKKKN